MKIETGLHYPFFEYVRPMTAEEVPPPADDVLDVAVLDMNHGWPNLGHDAIVRAVQYYAIRWQDPLMRARLRVRVISYGIRLRLVIPEPERFFPLTIGTGGPGHIVPELNDGVADFAQGIREDLTWEPRVWSLFDAIAADADRALIAICHTFGIVARWAGVADAVLRSNDKGGKSSGVKDAVLTASAIDHPWFAAFASQLADGRHFRIMDNRLVDMIPTGSSRIGGFIDLAHETVRRGGPAGTALTMFELDHASDAVMPRILAMNHHPEVVDREYILSILDDKHGRGEVTDEWYRERVDAFTNDYSDETDEEIHLTSEFNFLRPVEFHLLRAIRQKLEALGLDADGVDETNVLQRSGVAIAGDG